MSDNKWKDYILRSGLPFEFEVKKALQKIGFYCKSEFSYIRENEYNIPTEFSYDLDSEIIIGRHFFQLMLECKYRDELTNWLFLPEEFNYSSRGIGSTDFCNTNDYFYPKKYPELFKMLNVIRLCPLCSKGIEISKSGQNPKSIDHAISQLSYGMVDKVILAMEEILEEKNPEYFQVYHHIPIIITTANLFRINPNVTIDSIKESTNLSDIATAHEILLVEPSTSLDLKSYALKKLDEFEEKYSVDYLNSRLGPEMTERNKTFKDCKQIVSKFPNGILIMKYSKNGSCFKKLLKVLREIDAPSQKTIKLVQKVFGEKVGILEPFLQNSSRTYKKD